MPEDKTEELYAEALELAGYNAKALKAMCLWAEAHSHNKDAMKAASAAWGRNARNFGKAITYWYDDFMLSDLNADEILSRVSLASLPRIRAHVLYNEMRDKTLTYWQVRELVDAMRSRRERKATLAERIAAKVQSAYDAMANHDAMDSDCEVLFSTECNQLLDILVDPEVAKVLKNGDENKR